VQRAGIRGSFGWALAIHAGLVGLLVELPQRNVQAPAHPPFDETSATSALEIEVAVEAPASGLSPVPSSAPGSPVDSLRLASVEPRRAGQVLPGSTSLGVRGVSPRVEPGEDVLRAEPNANATNDGSWTFSPLRASPVDLGLGRGRYGDRVSGSPSGSYARSSSGSSLGAEGVPRTPSTDGAIASLRMGLDAHDREVGLGAAGPLVDATRQAVSASLVPNVARAVLEFTTDNKGLVVSVRVLDASADRRAWEDVTDVLITKTREKPLRVPPGAQGVAVTMQVEYKVTLPSGHDAGETALSVLGIPLKSSTAEHPIHVDVTTVLGGNIDLTDALMDAAGKPRRVVAAWVVGERRL
jgi:hypothetical protein